MFFGSFCGNAIFSRVRFPAQILDQTLEIRIQKKYVVKQVFAAAMLWFANSKNMCQSEMIEISLYVPWLPWKGSNHSLQLGSFWPGWCRFGACFGCVWGACGRAYFLLERLVFQWNASNVQFPAKCPEILVHLASIKNNCGSWSSRLLYLATLSCPHPVPVHCTHLWHPRTLPVPTHRTPHRTLHQYPVPIVPFFRTCTRTPLQCNPYLA